MSDRFLHSCPGEMRDSAEPLGFFEVHVLARVEVDHRACELGGIVARIERVIRRPAESGLQSCPVSRQVCPRGVTAPIPVTTTRGAWPFCFMFGSPIGLRNRRSVINSAPCVVMDALLLKSVAQKLAPAVRTDGSQSTNGETPNGRWIRHDQLIVQKSTQLDSIRPPPRQSSS